MNSLCISDGRKGHKRGEGDCKEEYDLTGLFWTKLCEKLSLERSFGYAEEEV
jgi:hypothetical protein